MEWLRNRRLIEQRKLIYQNMMATEGTLAGYFDGDPIISSWLSALASEIRTLEVSVADGDLLPLSGTERLLGINKELRRLYDTTASKYVYSFDQAHSPSMGWKEYFRLTQPF